MPFQLGFYEILLLALMALLVAWPCWRVCVKAGLPGPLGLVALIPLGLLVLLYVWALVQWPALRATAPERQPL